LYACHIGCVKPISRIAEAAHRNQSRHLRDFSLAKPAPWRVCAVAPASASCGDGLLAPAASPRARRQQLVLSPLAAPPALGMSCRSGASPLVSAIERASASSGAYRAKKPYPARSAFAGQLSCGGAACRTWIRRLYGMFDKTNVGPPEQSQLLGNSRRLQVRRSQRTERTNLYWSPSETPMKRRRSWRAERCLTAGEHLLVVSWMMPSFLTAPMTTSSNGNPARPCSESTGIVLCAVRGRGRWS